MSASQLLRILQTLPACPNEEISDFSTDELEATMNRGSRCTNPFLSNGEDNEVNFWTNRPVLESSTFGNEINNNHIDVSFRRPLALAKTTGFSIDKHLVECDLPELVVCYKESDFRVKDICIDEGIQDEETISIHKDNNHEFIYNSGMVNGDDDDMIEASLDTEFLNHEWLRSSKMACCYMDEESNSSNTSEEKLNLSTNLQDDVSTDQLANSNSMIFLQQDLSQKPLEFASRSSDLYDDDHINQHPLQGSKYKLGKRAIVGSIAKKQKNTFNESKIEEGVTFHFDTRKTKDSNPCETLNVPESMYELPLQTESVVNQQDTAWGNKMAVINHETRYGEGESSFSMAGVITELISCSRPMPFAGGISTRSDGSANSTRSFAFPTLETEYVSSPVRMVKAERKKLQKQRGWRKGLLCCRF